MATTACPRSGTAHSRYDGMDDQPRAPDRDGSKLAINSYSTLSDKPNQPKIHGVVVVVYLLGVTLSAPSMLCRPFGGHTTPRSQGYCATMRMWAIGLSGRPPDPGAKEEDREIRACVSITACDISRSRRQGFTTLGNTCNVVLLRSIVDRRSIEFGLSPRGHLGVATTACPDQGRLTVVTTGWTTNLVPPTGTARKLAINSYSTLS